VYVTPEIWATIIAGASLLVTLLGGFVRIIHRSDQKFATLIAAVDSKVTKLDKKHDDSFGRLDAKIDAAVDKLEKKIDVIAGDVVELKVAVARLEGPNPRLIARR
jgi:hypothetical protein